MLYLAAHALLKHGEGQLYLQRYYDVHLLLATSTFDTGLVARQAVALGWDGVLHRMLSLCAAWFGSPVPPGLLASWRRLARLAAASSCADVAPASVRCRSACHSAGWATYQPTAPAKVAASSGLRRSLARKSTFLYSQA